MQNHRSLRVYAAARRLACLVYAILPKMPPSERFALTEQMRRGATSVGSNIAEGCGRSTARDFCCYLDKALGAAQELEFQLGHCRDAKLVTSAEVDDALAVTLAVQRMLTRLIVKVRARDTASDR